MNVRVCAIWLAFCGALGCGGGGGGAGPEPPRSFAVQGAAQKGPLLSGSNVAIQELDAALRPTGRTFSTVTDGLGNFSVDVESASGLVEIIAEGYYFDEVSGKVSSAPLTLRGVADLSQGSDVHVNVLTHLSRDRIFLLVEAGEPFAEAKALAEGEVGELFRTVGPPVSGFEALDLSKPGEGNAYLLAASVIVMGAAAAADGANVTGELTSLLAALSDDLAADGQVADPGLTAPLGEAFAALDVEKVAENMGDRYGGADFSGLADVVNRPPTADAGEGGVVCVGNEVSLSAAGSADADGDALTYLWELASAPEGSTVAVAGSEQATASFIPDLAGEYVFTLVAADAYEGSRDEVRWTAGVCGGPPTALLVGEPEAAAGGELLFDAVETTDDSGTDGTPGTADADGSEGNRLPDPGEAVLSPLAADEIRVSVGCASCEDTVLERVILTYRDANGNPRSFAPAVSVALAEPLSAASPATLRLVAVPLEMKALPGGLRDVFLGRPSADGVYDSQGKELEAASTWTLGLEFFGRDTGSGELRRGQAAAVLRVQNPLGSPSSFPLTIEADTATREARLSWPAVDGAASYRLFWATNPFTWGEEAVAAGAVTVPGTRYVFPHPRFREYSFTLAPVAADGTVSVPSLPQTLTAFDQFPHYPAGATCVTCHMITGTNPAGADGIVSLLRPPSGVVASSGSPNGSVSLSWNPAWTASPGSVPWPWPVEYRVFGSPTSPVTIASERLGSTSDTAFTHRGEPGQTYHYRVMAVSENGLWSRLSTEVSVTTPP